MAATIQRFVDQVQIVRLGTLHDRETQDIVIDGLEKLVDAFGRRDAQAVEALMMAFIVSAESHFFAAHAQRQAAGVTRARTLGTHYY
jgi:DNA-binding GntR family transcriptional regulator